MGPQSAAPRATASSTALDTGSGKRGSRSITEIGLPAHVVSLLEREGVRDLADWRRLGKRRHEIFGIVPSVVRILDVAARERHEMRTQGA